MSPQLLLSLEILVTSLFRADHGDVPGAGAGCLRWERFQDVRCNNSRDKRGNFPLFGELLRALTIRGTRLSVLVNGQLYKVLVIVRLICAGDVHGQIEFVSEKSRAGFTLEPGDTGVNVSKVSNHHLARHALCFTLPTFKRTLLRFLPGPCLFRMGFKVVDKLFFGLEILVATFPGAY